MMCVCGYYVYVWGYDCGGEGYDMCGGYDICVCVMIVCVL